MPDQFGGVEVDEPVAPPAAGPARDEFGGVSVDDEALRLATTVPKSITGTIERAITYGAPASQMGRRINQRERAGGTFLPTESEEGDARQTGLFEPLVSIPRVAAEDPRFQAFLTGATGQPPTPETASGAAAAINVGAGLAEFPTSPLGPAALLAPGAGEIPAAATALGFAEQMAQGVPQAATEAGRLSVEGTPQERKEAYLGLGTQIALPATLTGESLIPRARVIPPRAPPGLPPRGRRITRTGSIDINYPPQPGERVTPPPVPPAPKPVSTPLATPEAEAAEAARLAAELGQEEEAPAAPAPSVKIPVYASDTLSARTGEEKFDLSRATKISKIVNDLGKEVYSIQYEEGGKTHVAFTDDPIVELHDKYAGEHPSYAKEFEALRKGKGEPTTTTTKLSPHDLEPALLVNGKPLRETGESTKNNHPDRGTHRGIMMDVVTNPDATEEQLNAVTDAFGKDSQHVFVDKAGKVYTRREAADALGEKDPLQSQRLKVLKEEAPAPAAKPAAPKAAPPTVKPTPEELHKTVENVMGQVRKDLEAEGWTFDPQWGPLELVLKPEWLDGFMYMGTHPHPTIPGRKLYDYKHGITRRYLVLDDEGQAYKYNGEKNTYEPMPLEQGIDRVFEGIEKQGETRESKYNEAYKRRRDEYLLQHGFSVTRATPEGVLTSVPTGPDATVIAGKTLAEWFKATKASDLPKGEARGVLANAIGAKNQPKEILKRLKDQDQVRAFVRDSKKPPLKPEEALPAATETEFDRITREQDELEAKRAASQGKGETFSVFQKAGLSKEQLAQVGELSLAESKELARFANAGDLNRENFAARLKEAKARAARSQKEAAIDVPAEVTPTAPEPTGLISEEAESLKRERLETPEVARGEGEPGHPLDKFLLAMGKFIGMQKLAGEGNVWRTPTITKAQFKKLAIEADKVGWTPVNQIERKGKGVVVDFQPKATDLEVQIQKIQRRIGMLEGIAKGETDFGMQVEGKPVTPEMAAELIKEAKAEILKLDPIVSTGFRDPATGKEFDTGPHHKWIEGMPTDQAEMKKLTQGFFTKSGKFLTRAQVEDLTGTMPHAGALELEQGPVPKPEPAQPAGLKPAESDVPVQQPLSLEGPIRPAPSKRLLMPPPVEVQGELYTFTPEEVKKANMACRVCGAVGAGAITPKYVQKTSSKGQTILDFGAGDRAPHTETLRKAGLDVTAYEFGQNVVPGVHDPNALSRKYDTVFASNVLNVQSGRPMLRATLKEIFNSTDGRAVFNYPKKPRYADLTTEDVAKEIEDIFGTKPIRVGGTKEAPIWEVRREAKPLEAAKLEEPPAPEPNQLPTDLASLKRLKSELEARLNEIEEQDKKQVKGTIFEGQVRYSSVKQVYDLITDVNTRIADLEKPEEPPVPPKAPGAYEPAYDETAGDIERMAKLQGMTIQEWKDQPLRIRSQQVADYRAAGYDMQALDKAIAEKDTRAASELVSRDPTKDKILRSYFEQLTGFEKPLDWEKSLAKIEEKVPEQPPAPPAPQGEAGVTGKTDVDVPDLAANAIDLSRRVDLDSGERRAIGRAIEDARAGKPQDLIDWVKKLKELAMPKAKVVKGIKFGGTGERAHDLIDWIQGNFPGGIRITSKADFARYMENKTGAARQILFMGRGDYADTVMGAAEKSGMGHWESQDEFLEDVLRAAGGRTTAAERLSREEQMLEDEAKQVEEFQLTALRNRGRTEAERNAAGKGVPVNTLVVGDTFRIKGQQVVVADVDPYGDVMLDGGRKWGAQRLSDGQTIYPDNGEIIKAPEEGSQGPGAASIAEFRARENRRRILANITGFLFGDRAGEVTDALLRKLAGEAVPKTMALAAESGNKMVRFASATTAGPHMARAQAREVLGDRFNDKPFRRRLGAVLVEDRLRAIRRGFLEAARGATDPAEQARLQAQANDVNTLVGPGRVFETEADFRRELRDPDIAGAIERHKQGPQYEAQLYHTTADGVLAGPGVNTGAFINLSPIYESSPQAIFTSSRKGDYTRPFKRRSIFSRRAAGTADVYELDYEPLVERMLRGNYEEYTKRELYDQLVRDNVAAVLPPGEPRPTFDGRPGEKFQIKRQTLVTTQGGQVRIIPQYENLWVHPDVAHELRQAEHIGSPISNVALARTAAVINKVQLALGTDAVWHIGNMFSTISGSQGGENFLVDLVRKVPLPNLVDTITRVTISARRILQNDPEVLNQIAELSQMGSIRADVPERGRVSRLINLLDKAGRVVRDDMYRNLTQRKNIFGKPLIEPSEAGRREWNNQLGQYNPRLMGQLESFFKEAGLAPFIVAARNFNRMALRKVTFSPGVRAANLTSAIQMRVVEAFGVFATLIAVPTILNMITTGKPAGRPGVPIGAIDTGRDDANGKHIYIDPAQWIGLRRGMRITGANALLEGMIRGQPARQIKKQMAHDFIGAVAHPWAGPIVQMGSVLGTGYTTAFFKESKDPGDYWENFKAAMKQINPVLHGWFQRQGKGVMGGVVGGLTTFAGAAGVKSRAPLSAVNQVHDLANGWASRSQDPRIRSEYESHARESFSSDYQELRSALIRKDLQGAKQAYRDLREKGKKPSVIAQTLQHPHPFTGSARAESQFKSSLTPKERELYDQAQLERKQLYQAFRVMLNTP